MQAARGTSLNHSGGDHTDHPDDPGHAEQSGHAMAERQHGGVPMRRTRLVVLFAVVAAAAYALDVVTKQLAVARLSGGSDVDLVGDLLVLHLTRNAGAAFSTGTQFTVALSCVAIVAVLVVLFLARRLGSPGWAVALGLLLAGVAGNLTDRVFREPGPLRGHVVDFLMLPHWPIFNIADVCINAAAVLILVQAARGVRINGAPTSDRAQGAR